MDAIELQEEIACIRHSALHLLSYRMRSKAELSQRLLQKNFGVNQGASVIDELEKKGYLKDREFAAVFVRDRVKNKKLGPAAVRNEIVRHQISRNSGRDHGGYLPRIPPGSTYFIYY